jgi:hypothetical protein
MFLKLFQTLQFQVVLKFESLKLHHFLKLRQLKLHQFLQFLLIVNSIRSKLFPSVLFQVVYKIV